jgi:hypothetical protein
MRRTEEHTVMTIRVAAILLRLAFFCLTFVAAASQVTPENGRLAGQITELPEGAPVRSAFVLIHAGAGEKDIIARLDSEARFDVTLTPGVYHIFASAGTFAPRCQAVRIIAGKTTHVAVKMELDIENSER